MKAHSEGMSDILSEVKLIASGAPSLSTLQQAIVETFARHLPHYNWTGFYMLDPGDPETLVVGPYFGEPTPHVRILLREGICGAAVASGETVVVDA